MKVTRIQDRKFQSKQQPGKLHDLATQARDLAKQRKSEAEMKASLGVSEMDDAPPLSLPPSPAGEDAPPAWPRLGSEALYGLPGDIVRAIDPYTEADQMAVLLNVLTAFGCMIGSSAHADVGYDLHPAKLFVIQVGDTSKGRKGTGWSVPHYLFAQCDPEWAQHRIKSGLSSGEGLIYHVRDAIWKHEPIREKGRVTGYQDVEVDPGETDKRLLIVEPEFASTLAVMERDGNILSTVIRQAWDNDKLSPLTRHNQIVATYAHICLLGHITKDELLARLDDTSKANGFANRFLWALVKRSKELPEGASLPGDALQDLVTRLRACTEFARSVGVLHRDDQAKRKWAAVYHDLSEGKPGLLGAVISRAEAQVLRLSLIYALLDLSPVVCIEHLHAALAVWDYCEHSARLIFGNRLGDPTADRMMEAIRQAPQGMTENDLYEFFGRHKSTNERARALSRLAALGLIRSEKQETGGRPRTVWVYA